MSKFEGKKTDNAKIGAKKRIRKIAMMEVETPAVLEVFCGAGEMYNDVWFEADDYLGIDKRKFFDRRKLMCGDADKLITRVNCDDFNVFDIDAYGSPYSILSHIAHNRTKKGPVVFCITDGSNMDLKMGRVSSSLRSLTGIEGHIIKRAHIVHDELIKVAIRTVANTMSKKVGAVKIARGNTGAAMRYYTFVLDD